MARAFVRALWGPGEPLRVSGSLLQRKGLNRNPKHTARKEGQVYTSPVIMCTTTQVLCRTCVAPKIPHSALQCKLGKRHYWHLPKKGETLATKEELLVIVEHNSPHSYFMQPFGSQGIKFCFHPSSLSHTMIYMSSLTRVLTHFSIPELISFHELFTLTDF